MTYICRKGFPFFSRKRKGLKREIIEWVFDKSWFVVGISVDHNPLFRENSRHRVVVGITGLAASDYSRKGEPSWSTTRAIVVPVRETEPLCCLSVVMLVSRFKFIDDLEHFEVN